MLYYNNILKREKKKIVLFYYYFFVLKKRIAHIESMQTLKTPLELWKKKPWQLYLVMLNYRYMVFKLNVGGSGGGSSRAVVCTTKGTANPSHEIFIFTTCPFSLHVRFIIYLRWSLRMNFLLHTGHTKFFSPVCVRVWRASSSDLANLLPQPLQLQGNGRSPEIKTITQYLVTYL